MVLENYCGKNILKKVIAAFLMFALVTSAFFGCAETPKNDGVPTETTVQETEPVQSEAEEEQPELIAVKPDPPAVAASKLAIVKRDFTKETFAASNGCELPYRLFIPIDYDESYAYPVLVNLHGMSEFDPSNNLPLEGFCFQEALVDREHPLNRCIIISPQCPYGRWSDYHLGGYSIDDSPITEPMAALVELLEHIDATYSTHPGRKYVVGVSMGGFGTWDLITRYPEKFAAAVPICGGGDSAYAYEVKDMYIHVYHDIGDETIPVIAARRMVDAIKAVGGERIEYTETSGYGHGIFGYILNEDDLSIYDWLFSKVKDGYVTVEE